MLQKTSKLIERVISWWQSGDEQTRENRKEAWYFEGMLFAGCIITGLGFFLVYNVSPYFTVVIVIGILCFGFSCLGLEGLKKLLQENLNEVNQQSQATL